MLMLRSSIGTVTLAAALLMTFFGAHAFDQSKYPDWKGVWNSQSPKRWTPTGEKAPLTEEYQALFEWNTKDQAAGGHGTEPSWTCLAPGMPRIMVVYEPMEIVITPATTYILISHIHDNRRIFTDGRDWPKDVEPSFRGYSIGKWIDEDGDGRYDVLAIETRGFKGPRIFDPTGIPLHEDNGTVIKERFRLVEDGVVEDEITTIDSALTKPWTVTRKFKRQPRAAWAEYVCQEHNTLLVLQKETYFIREDGYLMPSRRDQPPPDLRRFQEPTN
jgi:hypothetical protein